MKPDVVIIGAGVIGSSIACHLAARGVRNVLVVDRAADFGAGSTARATGGFRAQFGTEVNVRLSMLSREKLLRFEDEIGVDSGYRQYGYLFMARNRYELDELTRAQQVQHACGLTEAKTIDAEEIRRLNPAVRDESLIGGTFCPTDGFIVAMQILRGYAAAAQRLGVKFEFGKALSRRERGALSGATGRVRGEQIFINAAGAWANEVSNVPVTPLRRRVAATVPTNVLPQNMPMTIWVGDAFHVRVRDGRVLLIWPDTPPNDEAWLGTVRRWAHERVPVLRDVPIDPQQSWEGLYEMSPDRHAIIGRDPERENLDLANGSSGHGVMHSPAIGQLVAEMIVDGKTSIDISALRPSRFAEGKPISGPQLL
ncbi:MAG TPA: FAD-dependent oxidoreductase [Thermoanaerobaculia bacterium]|nr:FAD-dependent oxidoreductase [Thermoanaerobaculia bacterium]